MGVEVDYRDGPIDFAQRTEDGENDGVVAAKAGGGGEVKR